MLMPCFVLLAVRCLQFVQRRRFDCVNMTTNAVVPHIWCSGPKPDLGDVECPGPENCTAANVQPTPMTEDTPLGGGTSTSSNAAAGPTTVTDISPDASQPSAGTAGAGNTDGSSNSNSNSAGTAEGQAATSNSAAAATAASDNAKPAAAEGSEWTAHTAQANSQGNNMLTALGGAGSSSGIAASNSGTNSGQATPLSGGSGATAVGGSNTNNGGSSPNSASFGSAVSGSNAQAQSANAAPRPQNAVLVTPAINTVPVPTAAAASAFANSSWDVLMQELGPGQVLPEWLLKDPTPLLKSLMDCPSSYAVSVDGKCCGGKEQAARPGARMLMCRSCALRPSLVCVWQTLVMLMMCCT
jgi:hypothetical protein